MRTPNTLNPKPVLVWVLLACAVLALFIVSDYSLALDDNHHLNLGKLSLEAYSLSYIKDPNGFKNMGVDRYYGPAFNTFSQWASETLQAIWPQIATSDVYHYTQFLSFLLAGYCVFLISQRLMDDWIAFSASLLFLTQPLLLGHGFINPKDTPFMAFFTASIAAGLIMVDRHRPSESRPFQPGPLVDRLKADWKPLRSSNKGIIIAILFFLLTAGLGASVFSGSLDALAANTIASLYHSDQSSFFGSLFHRFAGGAGGLPVEAYVHKGTLLFFRALAGLSIALFITLVTLTRRWLPGFSGAIWHGYLNPVLSEFHPGRILNGFKQREVWVAGVTLGLASSMRIIGPAAGGLAALYAIGKFKKKSIPLLAAYFGIAAIVMFITWPFLWANPLKNYLEGWSVFANFPWVGGVLFDGQIFPSTNLPLSYLPTLMGIQLTEPALILAGIFTALFLSRKIDKDLDRLQLGILFLWFLAPLLYVFVFRPVMYDNFRQFLFIIPPVFIFAGIGLQHLTRRINHLRLKLLLILAVLLPGVISSVHLHPYEYIYFNSFVGGVEGAFRDYELDYWFTSHKEAILYLNQVAPPDAEIVVTSGNNIAAYYAREDLQITRYDSLTKPITDYDYFILHTRGNKDLKIQIPGDAIFLVEKQGAVLDRVIKIEPDP